MSKRETDVEVAGRPESVEPAAHAGAARVGAARSAAAGRSDALDALQERLTEFAVARDWQQYHLPKNLAAALSVEAGELLEIFQWLTPEQAAAVMADADRAHRVRDEVADVLAYLLQFCTAVGVDPVVALAEKIERNELRFPVPERGAEAGTGTGAGTDIGTGAGAGVGASTSTGAFTSDDEDD